jgi:hypothetical protein
MIRARLLVRMTDGRELGVVGPGAMSRGMHGASVGVHDPGGIRSDRATWQKNSCSVMRRSTIWKRCEVF